jgi:membrane fusion protein (multidrug efflux system)
MNEKPIRTSLAFTVLLMFLALAGCSAKHPEAGEHESVSRLQASEPLRKEATITRKFVGQVHAARHIELEALEKGYLLDVSVKEGQAVRKGQLMFRILPPAYEAELAKARAEAQAAKVEYENTAMLAKNQVVAPTELAIAKAKYDQALASVNLAEVHLGFTRIHAPFDGIMDRLLVREGSMVEEGTRLTTLSDNSTVWVYFNVPEAEYLNYASELTVRGEISVELLMANGKIFDQVGKIAAIEAEFNHETGTIPFRADFPNPKALLRHGQTGNVLMKTSLPDALLIPQKATFQILDHTYVFVVGADGKAKQQRIEIAEELEDLFVVIKGLTEKDRILVEGVRQVTDGQKVEVEYVAPEKVYANLKTRAE